MKVLCVCYKSEIIFAALKTLDDSSQKLRCYHVTCGWIDHIPIVLDPSLLRILIPYCFSRNENNFSNPDALPDFFRSARTSFTTSSGPACPFVCKKNLNHLYTGIYALWIIGQKTHQTNPMAPWDISTPLPDPNPPVFQLCFQCPTWTCPMLKKHPTCWALPSNEEPVSLIQSDILRSNYKAM